MSVTRMPRLCPGLSFTAVRLDVTADPDPAEQITAFCLYVCVCVQAMIIDFKLPWPSNTAGESTTYAMLKL